MPAYKQVRTARETLDVFVPLAHKLGVWDIKTELEDLSFRILHAQEHAALQYMIQSRISLLSAMFTTRFGPTRMTMTEVRGPQPLPYGPHKVHRQTLGGAALTRKVLVA